ncbi:hypothetical protein ACVINW_000577 [Bradyrhizobium sp. USDA 4461]
MPRSADSTTESVASSTPGSTRMRPPSPQSRPLHRPWPAAQSPQLHLYLRNTLGLANPPATALGANLDRHEVLGFAGERRRHLASLHREQSARNAIAPRHLGDVRSLLKALRRDPGLLLARPPSSPALPSGHLNAAIRVTFLPGSKHGICHRATSTDQLLPAGIADKLRHCEVRPSCRLLLDGNCRSRKSAGVVNLPSIGDAVVLKSAGVT